MINVVGDDERSCSGECFKFVFLFDLFLFIIIFEIMAKLRGVSSRREKSY